MKVARKIIKYKEVNKSESQKSVISFQFVFSLYAALHDFLNSLDLSNIYHLICIAFLQDSKVGSSRDPFER